jgi:hypothetical protein
MVGAHCRRLATKSVAHLHSERGRRKSGETLRVKTILTVSCVGLAPICCENRQRYLAVSNVVVDPFGEKIFAGLKSFHRLDKSIFLQLADNIVALCFGVRICGVGDLK